MRYDKMTDREKATFRACLDILYGHLELVDNSEALSECIDCNNKLWAVDEFDLYILETRIVQMSADNETKYKNLIRFLDHPEERFNFVSYSR